MRPIGWSIIQCEIRCGVQPTVYKGSPTCATMEFMSPALVGSSTVLLCLARLEKAAIYCSATLYDTALPPFCGNDSKYLIGGTGTFGYGLGRAAVMYCLV